MGRCRKLRTQRNHICGGRRDNGRNHFASFMRMLGIVLMVIGGLILLFAMPVKVWLALVGLVLLVFGFVLWRFG